MQGEKSDINWGIQDKWSVVKQASVQFAKGQFAVSYTPILELIRHVQIQASVSVWSWKLSDHKHQAEFNLSPIVLNVL